MKIAKAWKVFTGSGIDAGKNWRAITTVTHLHGDHVGWNTHLVDGRWEPFFPGATYYLPKTDFAVFKVHYDARSSRR